MSSVSLELEAVGNEEVPCSVSPGTAAEGLTVPSTSASRAHGALKEHIYNTADLGFYDYGGL